jgi:hypothetical protein
MHVIRRWSVSTLVAVVIGLGLGLVTAPLTSTPAGAAALGRVYSFASAKDFGSPGQVNLPPVGMASTPSGNGYWVTAGDGGVFAYGDAGFFGSAGGIHLNRPVVGMAATPSGQGYWFVASDGGIFAYGPAAAFHGSTGGMTLNKPIVGMAVTPSGRGYWLVASDGGIFAFGDALFWGSTGDKVLNKPIVGIASTPTGLGYWLVASDGGIFAFGDAQFHGSAGAIALASPIVGMAATMDGFGYWFVAADGGIFAYGNAGFYGSLGGQSFPGAIVGMARPTPNNGGYWLLNAGTTSLCVDDPAAEDTDTQSHPQIDLVRVCINVTADGLVVDLSVTQPMTREQLLASLRSQSDPNADATGYILALLNDPTGEAVDALSLGADAGGPWLDIFADPNSPDPTRHIGIGLAVNGATYTIGPVPWAQIPEIAKTFYLGAITLYAHPTGGGNGDVFIDVAPDADEAAGPLVRP